MISSPVDIPRLRARQHIERRMATTKESAAAPQNRPMIVNLRRRESEFEDEDAVGLAITAEEVGLASSAEHCKGRSKNWIENRRSAMLSRSERRWDSQVPGSSSWSIIYNHRVDHWLEQKPLQMGTSSWGVCGNQARTHGMDDFAVKLASQHEKVQVYHHRDDSKAVHCIPGTFEFLILILILQLGDYLTDTTAVRSCVARASRMNLFREINVSTILRACDFTWERVLLCRGCPFAE